MTRRLLSIALLVNALAPRAGAAADGSVVGWVEDARGVPVAGALVSLFGRGLRGGGLVTLSDSTGRFVLPSLPAGSYTVRALGGNRAATRQITVLPNRDSVFTLSIGAAASAAADLEALEAKSAEARELRWLLRHKRRSVLETSDAIVTSPDAPSDAPRADRDALDEIVPWLPAFGAEVGWASAAPVFRGDPDALPGPQPSTPNLGSLKLGGRLPNGGHWSLGGLVADTESTTWRMAAEFVLEPGAGQELQVGAGYGTRFLEPNLGQASAGDLDNRAVGALFVHDRWRISERFSAGVGARFNYVGFLADRTQMSPTASLEWRPYRHTRLKVESSARTLTPGGDLFTLSTLQSAPAMTLAVMSDDLRPERITRHELTLERSLGGATLSGFVFREGVRDRLVNLVADGPSHSLHILNGRGVVVHGSGVRLGRRIGESFNGSLTYTFGHSRPGALGKTRPSPATLLEADYGLPLSMSEADFHDFVGRFETFLDWTDTRFVAYYRINTQSPEADGLRSRTSTRYEVQLAQNIPFLRSMTRAEWELLLAVRNLFYETTEGATLDEMAVLNPPRRVLGGISVRF
jgi:hypothetical protein